MKAKLLQDGAQKTYVLIFETGDEVASGLLDFAKRHHLGGSHFTAIGALSEVTLGYFDWKKRNT